MLINLLANCSILRVYGDFAYRILRILIDTINNKIKFNFTIIIQFLSETITVKKRRLTLMLPEGGLLIGIITVIFGIIVMIFPKILNYIIGIYLIIIGILGILQSM